MRGDGGQKVVSLEGSRLGMGPRGFSGELKMASVWPCAGYTGVPLWQFTEL